MMVGDNLKPRELQQVVDKTFFFSDLDGDGRISFEEFCKVVDTMDVFQKMIVDRIWTQFNSHSFTYSSISNNSVWCITWRFRSFQMEVRSEYLKVHKLLSSFLAFWRQFGPPLCRMERSLNLSVVLFNFASEPYSCGVQEWKKKRRKKCFRVISYERHLSSFVSSNAHGLCSHTPYASTTKSVHQTPVYYRTLFWLLLI